MGMSPPVDFLQPLQAHVRVDLGGGEAGVPEQLLHGPDVGAPVEQVRGEGVAERVRGHALAEVGPGKVLAEDEADAAVRDPPAPLVDEQGARGVAETRRPWAYGARGRTCTARSAATAVAPRNTLRSLAPLPMTRRARFLRSTSAQVQGDQLRDPAARGVQGLQNRPVAQLPERSSPGQAVCGHLHQARHLLLEEERGQALLRAQAPDLREGIGADGAASLQEAVPAPHARDDAVDRARREPLPCQPAHEAPRIRERRPRSGSTPRSLRYASYFSRSFP